MKKKRRTTSNNLSLLDVMACGLGAAVLLFLIVKHHTGAPPVVEEAVSSEREVLTELNLAEAALREQIEAIEQQIATRHSLNQSNDEQLADYRAKQAELAQLQIQIAREEVRNTALEEQVVKQQPMQTADLIEDPRVGEEDYLIGLKVEGKRIALLIDRSASMTDGKLVDIIVRKVGSTADKRKGPKWHRTIRVARWLLARLPDDSRVSVVAFNEKAEILNRGRWAESRDSKQISGIINEIANLVPTGATNLESALRALSKLNPRPTDIYLITDGLPTQSVSSPGATSRCRRKAKTVSGRCRIKLFEVSVSKSSPRDIKKVSVILLPLEGDPDAAPLYWNWTASTGGMMLIPAVGWP